MLETMLKTKNLKAFGGSRLPIRPRTILFVSVLGWTMAVPDAKATECVMGGDPEAIIPACSEFLTSIKSEIESLSAAFLARGNAHETLGYYDEALRDYQVFLALRPDDYEVAFVIANTYLRIGDVEKAIRQYKELLSQRPNDARLLNNLGNAHEKNGNFEEAVDFWLRSIKNDARRRDLWLDYLETNALIADRAGLEDEAFRAAIMACAISPEC